MRHLRPICLLLGCLALPAAAADLSLDAILSPVSGCALGSATVTVRMFNVGPTLPAGSRFDVFYAVSLGTPVTEGVVLGSPLLQNGAMIYSFTTPANLSLPGNCVFDAGVNLPADVNPSNNAATGHAVANDAPSVGGSVTGPPAPTLAGTLHLAGYTGEVLQWEESPDGQRWFALANACATQAFSGLRATTQFRARVRSGSCAEAVSGSVTVTP